MNACHWWAQEEAKKHLSMAEDNEQRAAQARDPRAKARLLQDAETERAKAEQLQRWL